MAKKFKRDYQGDFKRQCLSVPGQHVLIIGVTGSGKSTAQYWILEGIIKANVGG
jgi:energy-coupling factor transporter ATP-binding protein EcfA2